MKKIRTAIAGFGVVGKRRYSILSKSKNIEVVAICDRNINKDLIIPNNICKYSNYIDMLDSEKIDAIFISLTNDIAPQATIDSLNKNIHVFCEKPPGRSVEDVKKVIAAEKNKKEKGIVLMYGFNHRYQESVVHALNIVNSKSLGKIINLRGIYGKSMLVTFDQSDWRTKKEIAGGGVLLDQGIHMVDLMRLFAGEFSEVYSFVSNGYWEYDVEDNAYALMKTKDNIVGFLHSSATEWRHKFTLDITLEHGAIKLEGILSGSKSYGNETLTVVNSFPDTDGGNPNSQTTLYNSDPSWQREIEKFIELISGKNIENTCDSSEALKTIELVFKIYESDKNYKYLN